MIKCKWCLNTLWHSCSHLCLKLEANLFYFTFTHRLTPGDWKQWKQQQQDQQHTDTHWCQEQVVRKVWNVMPFEVVRVVLISATGSFITELSPLLAECHRNTLNLPKKRTQPSRTTAEFGSRLKLITVRTRAHAQPRCSPWSTGIKGTGLFFCIFLLCAS